MDLPPTDPIISSSLATVYSVLMGLLVGSFLNVAIHRLPTEGESIFKPLRSRCPKCRTTLTWYENIPVLSWLVLFGRCRTCRSSIHWRYPLVEILTALLFWVAADSFMGDTTHIAIVALVLSGLLVATFVDLDCYEIPDEVSLGGCVLAPLLSFLVPRLHELDLDRFSALGECLLGMAVGGGILYFIGWLGTKVYRVDAMGLGDVKLAAAGGGFIGASGILYALLVAAILGSLVGILNMLRLYCELRLRVARRNRRDGRLRSLQAARLAGRYIPFGPYLAVGIALSLLGWNDDGALVFQFLLN
ncbi:MAG TPA: prepilin peptidase [Planctomycetes bacterium]|nr:prepilin peptidase [Planctomycetota bacterium]HIL36867.1 prepilin peptidase [Planctomycetota bacterium]